MTDTGSSVSRAPPTGRAAGPLGGVLLVVEHHWTWYRRNWRATAVSSILQPLLFLLAFGVGFGALVDGTGRAAAGHRRRRLPRVARAGPAVRLGGADGGVRLDLPGALRLQVAAHLPRDDGHARSRPAQVAPGTSPG